MRSATGRIEEDDTVGFRDVVTVSSCQWIVGRLKLAARGRLTRVLRIRPNARLRNSRRVGDVYS